MDIQTFVQVVSNLPPHIAVLTRGATGVGKSQIFHQIGSNLNLPVIDRRLSQMTEGDIIGLPELTDGVTRFAPVDWVVRASQEPVVLFLDEINRATVEVQQCAFQLVLDREINGVKLHPETRIYAAINEGAHYQVNEMGPALVRRFWTVDLEPTTADWLNWAKTSGIDILVTEFIKQNPGHLRYKGEFEPGKVYPNPASWHRLDESLKYAKMEPKNSCSAKVPPGFYATCLGFIGIEASIAFVDFIEKYQMQYSAEDVIDNWSTKKDLILSLNDDKHNDLIEKIVEHAKENAWDVKQAVNACEFVETTSGEMLVNFFNKIMATEDLDLIRKIHKLIGSKVVEIVNTSNEIK